ncbi:MAG: hypothetical protein IT292_02940 [Deltaproteobacteria bacterium]|nr:hypothetical protein [Deltaproteobacteria bacterium]
MSEISSLFIVAMLSVLFVACGSDNSSLNQNAIYKNYYVFKAGQLELTPDGSYRGLINLTDLSEETAGLN